MLVKTKDPLEQLCSSFEFAFHYQIQDCKLNIVPTKENVVLPFQYSLVLHLVFYIFFTLTIENETRCSSSISIRMQNHWSMWYKRPYVEKM